MELSECTILTFSVVDLYCGMVSVLICVSVNRRMDLARYMGSSDELSHISASSDDYGVVTHQTCD